MRREIYFDYSKLRGKIVEKYRTQNEFAKAINISNRAMSLKLNNLIGLSQDDIIKWCSMLDIEENQIGEYFFKIEVSKLKQ